MRALRALPIVVVLLALSAATCAGGWYSPPPDSLAGQQYVQFSVSSNLTLKAFQGKMFSYQRFLSDTRAVRLAGELSLDLSEDESDIEYEGGAVSGSVDLSTWSHSGTIRAQFLFYHGNGPIRLFWGGGPKVTYVDIHSESVNYSPYDDELTFVYYTSDTDRWGVGLQGLAGLQWFINDMFSLHAEYAVSGMYVREDSTSHRVYSHDPDSNRSTASTVRSPRLTSDGVRFGLSAHF